jgi:AraC family transcriptional regulator
MDWLDRMNLAMDYIETHLTENVDFDQAAQMACCSTYHFQRMFSFITNVPLSEYIRRRRLTMAAFELQNTETKIIDLAFKYGYESPEAFSRAFSKLHGLTPMSARNKGATLKAYPRMSFHISIKGDSEMNWRIEEKDGFEVFGLELQTNVIDGQCFKDIPAFWDVCENDGRCIALAEAAGKKRNELLDAGITYDHKPDGGMKYMIACIKHMEVASAEFTVLSIPKQTWAVFSVEWQPGQTNDNLHDTWRRIHSEWFPTASYEHADCDYDMERYFGKEKSEYGVEVWIPVVKK